MTFKNLVLHTNCFHYFGGIETAGAVDAASLVEHLITFYASARDFSAEEEEKSPTPELVKYRAALVV